jgi:hypothetical protein
MLNFIEQVCLKRGLGLIAVNSELNRNDAHEYYHKRGFITQGYSFIKEVK